jgi:hypothetical protein
VKATLRYGHIDRAPLGDLETTLLVLLAGHPDLGIVFRHAVGGREFELHSRDLVEALGGARIGSPEGLALTREALRTGEADLAAHAVAGAYLGP